MKNFTYFINTKQFKLALEFAEKEAYIKAYTYNNMNQSKTAHSLGVSRSTVIYKLKQFKLL